MADEERVVPRTRRTRRLVVALIGILVVGGAFGLLHPKLRWRLDVACSKAFGRLPDVAWGDLLPTIAPARLRSWANAPTLELSLEPAADGTALTLFTTSFGDFWGQPDDRGAMETALRYRICDKMFLRGPVAVRGGDVVLDGGSHLGTFTRFALEAGARLVVAFEPDPGSVTCFRRTFDREMAAGRVILVEKALWEKVETLRFYECATSTDGSVVHQHDHGPGEHPVIEIPATTVDEAVASLKLERVDFIKLNIEGAERQALIGAQGTLARFRPRMVVNLIHDPGDSVAIPAFVRKVVPAYQVKFRSDEQAYFHAE